MVACSKVLAILLVLVGVWLATPTGQIFVLTFTSFVKTLGDKERMEPDFVALRTSLPLAGRTCMITGANRGLGKATAAELVAMGCHVLMGCRPGTPAASVDEVLALAHGLAAAKTGDGESPAGSASLVTLDVSDLDSVDDCVASLKATGVVLDLLIINAAVVPLRSSLSAQLFEKAFATNYLGHWALTELLLKEGLITGSKGGAVSREGRIVVVASEAHKMGKMLSEEELPLGAPVAYEIGGSMDMYSHTKLCLTSWTHELYRRLRADASVHVRVNLYDPGPVDSDIAREAPDWLKPVLKLMFALMFKTPAAASMPAAWLGARPEDDTTQPSAVAPPYYVYWTPGDAREDAVDPTIGFKLHSDTLQLVASRSPPKMERS